MGVSDFRGYTGMGATAGHKNLGSYEGETIFAQHILTKKG